MTMVCHDRRMSEAIGDASSAGMTETTKATASPVAWNRAELERVGFVGFVPLVGMDRSILPRRHGIYVVLYESDERPKFLASNVITKRMPYDPVHLEGKWLMGASVVYIGKAQGRDGLRTRVGAFSRQRTNHSGGRALWQLDSAGDLLVAWLETPGESALAVEKSYLQAFKAAHGGYPFANRRG
jgi:hypothetical protein